MALRGILFDLFHTLTGQESEWSELPWTSDFLGIDRTRWDELLAHSRRRLTGQECDPYTIIRTLAHAVDPTIPETKIRQATELRIQRFRRALGQIPPENLATLGRLRAAGIRLGLISNADVMEAAAWEDSPLAEFFDAAIFSCAFGCAKPEPAIYHQCLAALGLKPEECLFVGDGGSRELEGAKQVGLRTVFVSGVIAELWPARVSDRIEIADHHITQLSQILGLVI